MIVRSYWPVWPSLFVYASCSLCAAQLLYTISIDILHTSSTKEFVKELGPAAFATVAQRSEKLKRNFLLTLKSLTASFGYDPINAAPTFNIKLGDISSPDYTLDEIFSFLESADKPCIIAIDEFQRVASYPEKNVEELLRGKIQGNPFWNI